MGGFSVVSAVNPYTDAEAITAVRGDAETLAVLLKGGNLLHIPTNAGWTETKVGSGGSSQDTSGNYVKTGVTASSSALLYGIMYGAFLSVGYDKLNFDKKTRFIFNYGRSTSEAETTARVQLKNGNAIGALSGVGIGLKVVNLASIFALWGESYGTELGELDLATTIVSDTVYQIEIVHYPASKIEWYVNGTLKGTQSTAAKIPSGITGNGRIVHSIANGATGGTDALSRLYQPKLWTAI